MRHNSRPLKRLKNWFIYRAIQVAVAFVRRLSFNAGLRLGRLLGLAGYYLAFGQRRLAQHHLRLAFPSWTEKKVRRTVRESFAHLGMGVMELVNLHRLDGGLDSLVELPPEERARLDEAHALGRGVICISAHLGNWELLARYIAHLGYPVHVVARELYDPRLNRLITDFREEGRVRTILRDDDHLTRRLLEVFHESGLLALLIDQDTRVPGVFVDFFGRPAYTPSAAASLALRTKAPVLGSFIHREPGGKHHISFVPVEITPCSSREGKGEQTQDVQGDKEEALITSTQKMTTAIENAIRNHPEQWVWMHERWKTTERP